MSVFNDPLKLQDKTAIITNPKSMFGRAIALRLAELGVDVALVGPQDRECERLTEQIMDQREIKDAFGRAIFIPVDFQNIKQVEDAVGKSAESFGGIDILIDCNMTSAVTSFLNPEAISRFDELIQVNMKAPLILTHKAIKFLKAKKRGRILYLIPDLQRFGLEEDSLGALTRTSLMNFAKSLSREFIGDNVGVNCLAVGPSEEFLLQRFPQAKSLSQAQDELLKTLPRFRMIDASEIANTVAYLVSPTSTAITGQTIAASGGLTMY